MSGIVRCLQSHDEPDSEVNVEKSLVDDHTDMPETVQDSPFVDQVEEPIQVEKYSITYTPPAPSRFAETPPNTQEYHTDSETDSKD